MWLNPSANAGNAGTTGSADTEGQFAQELHHVLDILRALSVARKPAGRAAGRTDMAGNGT